jgi:aminopeptidase-like protein
MATKMERIDSKEFKVWSDKYKRTTVRQIADDLRKRETPLSEHTIGNIMRTQYATYKSYCIMADYYGTKKEEVPA